MEIESQSMNTNRETKIISSHNSLLFELRSNQPHIEEIQSSIQILLSISKGGNQIEQKLAKNSLSEILDYVTIIIEASSENIYSALIILKELGHPKLIIEIAQICLYNQSSNITELYKEIFIQSISRKELDQQIFIDVVKNQWKLALEEASKFPLEKINQLRKCWKSNEIMEFIEGQRTRLIGNILSCVNLYIEIVQKLNQEFLQHFDIESRQLIKECIKVEDQQVKKMTTIICLIILKLVPKLSEELLIFFQEIVEEKIFKDDVLLKHSLQLKYELILKDKQDIKQTLDYLKSVQVLIQEKKGRNLERNLRLVKRLKANLKRR